MKNIIKLTFIFPLFCFFSCNKVTKINTVFGINSTSNRILKSIDKSRFISLIEDKSTFVLVQTTTSCECSSTFENIVNQYILNTGLLIYKIDYNEVKDTTYNFSWRNDSPTFHIVDKGSNQYKLEQIYSSSNYDFFNNINTFSDFMNKYIYSPTIFYVDESELDSLYLKDNKFVIYFTKSDCSDCKYLINDILFDYASNNELPKMYIFDFEGLDESSFLTVKNKYGLTIDSNAKWGYKTGATPTIFTINPNVSHDYISSIDQGFVFGNDILDSSYKVTSSYYDSNRITNIKYSTISNQVGTQYSSDDVVLKGDYYFLKNEVNKTKYKNVFNDFLTYCKNFLN